MYSRKLKELRTNKNIKVDEMANYLSLSKKGYINYENENFICPIKHLIKICEFFDVSLDYIFGFVNESNYKNNKHKIDRKISGERLKKMRLSLYLNQENLSDILGVSRSNISDYETGRNTISTLNLYNLCKLYNISADYLLGKTNNPKTIHVNEEKVKWKIEDTTYIYSTRLKDLRENNNLKREDLANVIGIHISKYSQYEKESLIFPLKHINTLCNYFDISIDYFLGLTDNKKYNNYKPEINLKVQGSNLKQLRKKLGLTMDSLAKSIGTTYGSIRNYEHGKILISTKVLYKICKEYNISADLLLGKINN